MRIKKSGGGVGEKTNLNDFFFNYVVSNVLQFSEVLVIEIRKISADLTAEYVEFKRTPYPKEVIFL